MSRIKRLAVKEEPTLNVQRYVVKITKGRRTGYRYCLSLKGPVNSVQEVKRMAEKGARIDVFKATHEFKEAWQK